jgi:hypothetical protein
MEEFSIFKRNRSRARPKAEYRAKRGVKSSEANHVKRDAMAMVMVMAML